MYVTDRVYGFECEYEPIQIKYDDGYMTVCPPALLTECSLSKIRAVFRLSVISDLVHGTNTVSAWRKEIESIRREYNQYADFLTGLTDDGSDYKNAFLTPRELRTGSQSLDAEFYKKHIDGIKRADTKIKKLNKCVNALEELVQKYKVKE